MFTRFTAHRLPSTCGWLKAAVSPRYLTFFFKIQKEKKKKTDKKSKCQSLNEAKKPFLKFSSSSGQVHVFSLRDINCSRQKAMMQPIVMPVLGLLVLWVQTITTMKDMTAIRFFLLSFPGVCYLGAEGIVLLKGFGSLSEDSGLGLGVGGVQDLVLFCWVGSPVGTSTERGQWERKCLRLFQLNLPRPFLHLLSRVQKSRGFVPIFACQQIWVFFVGEDFIYSKKF